eukprot:5128412-Prymnesium_polylepis.1
MGLDPNGSSGGASASGAAAATLRVAAWAPPVRNVFVDPATEGVLSAALRHVANTDKSGAAGGGAQAGAAGGGGAASDGRDGGTGRRPRDGGRPARTGLPPPPPVVRNGGPCATTRGSLPVAAYRTELLRALREPACVVEGET